MFFCFRPDCCPQDKEYDSWNSIADYVFQVIPTFMSSLSHSTLSMEEFKRYIRLDAPSESRRDSCGKPYRLDEFPTLTFGRWETPVIFHLCWRDTSHVLLWMRTEVNFCSVNHLLDHASFFSVAGIDCGETLTSQAATMDPPPNEPRGENGTPSFLISTIWSADYFINHKFSATIPRSLYRLIASSPPNPSIIPTP